MHAAKPNLSENPVNLIILLKLCDFHTWHVTKDSVPKSLPKQRVTEKRVHYATTPWRPIPHKRFPQHSTCLILRSKRLSCFGFPASAIGAHLYTYGLFPSRLIETFKSTPFYAHELREEYFRKVGLAGGAADGQSGDAILNLHPRSIDADVKYYRELFSKLKFNFLEQETKEKFLKAILQEPPLVIEAKDNRELGELSPSINTPKIRSLSVFDPRSQPTVCLDYWLTFNVSYQSLRIKIRRKF
ncbi:hypothetical protein BC937DRAFT_87890 [Endogone sp. FLAS-F59071]|nr:hypothetical protein BC937DRAFT_87890 [Endogone sp. FLAS-F59071]|eukprot:RUS19175.1 hypothetical protein BC937DRAFT_87890 [Endogone sp. FLAS-F59071]